MKRLINDKIPTNNYISQWESGRFRFIVKCPAGFMTISDAHDSDNKLCMQSPDQLLNLHKKGALQTIQFQPEGTDIWLTVFARTGKKIHVCDEEILRSLTVGTINQYWTNTEFYDQAQYSRVGAINWLSRAYVMND